MEQIKDDKSKKIKFSMKLIIKKQDKCGIDFIVENVSDGLIDFLKLPVHSAFIGKSVRYLFAEEQQMVDEWTDYLLKFRINPKQKEGDLRIANTVTRSAIQLLQSSKTWVAVTFTYLLDEENVLIGFAPVPEGAMMVGIRHYIEIKQALWLEEYISNGCNWEIDRETQMVVLTRRFSKLLKLADRAIVISLEQFFELAHPEDRQKLKDAIQNVSTMHSMITSRSMLRWQHDLFEFICGTGV